MTLPYQQYIWLVDKDGKSRQHRLRWNAARVPHNVWVGDVQFDRTGDHMGVPCYREVADGYQQPMVDTPYVIMTPTGAEIARGVLPHGLPPTIPYGDTQATLTSIAGPEGRVRYTVETSPWPTHP